MGREIRMVPPHWRHPKRVNPYNGREEDQPMFNHRFEDVFTEWLSEFDRMRAGKLTEFERECYPNGLADWLEADGRVPERAFYRPWADAEATWFQVWQTVSEGSPVTPPFATRAELVDYLVANGDFWDQVRYASGRQREKPGYSRESAERFVNAGWAPSFAVVPCSEGRVIKSGIEAA